MVIEHDTTRGADAGVDEREWDRLVEQIRAGDCTPFIGTGACAGTLPDEAELSRTWAERYNYPFSNGAVLADVMQYISILDGDRVTSKRRLARDLRAKGPPDFDDPAQPHALLARHPIAIYLTTNYDDFMTRALINAGKEPLTRICHWYAASPIEPASLLPPDFEPQSHTPLVFHLHGSFSHPEMLVVSEDDYLEFVTTLIAERGRVDRDIIPHQVLPALTRKPLLFVGYTLRDLSVRFLFHLLVQRVPAPHQRRHISVQLVPPTHGAGKEVQDKRIDYLTKYLERLNIAVYWGSTAAFCRELASRLGHI